MHNAAKFFWRRRKNCACQSASTYNITMLISPSQAMKARLLQLREWLRPSAYVARSEAELRLLARDLRPCALYYDARCPRSLRVRSLVQQLNLPLECRDIRRSQVYRDDLLAGVGRLSEPALRTVESGEVRWLASAEAISDYLHARCGLLPQAQGAH